MDRMLWRKKISYGCRTVTDAVTQLSYWCRNCTDATQLRMP